MSGKVIRSSWLRETPFFEIAGVPGRLYLEAFAFGDIDKLPPDPFANGNFDRLPADLGLGGPNLRSPLTLFPDAKKSNTLLTNLDKLRSSAIVYDVATAIASCSIRADWKNGARTETTTKYLFFKCTFLNNLRLFGVNGFKVEFGTHQRGESFLTKRSW